MREVVVVSAMRTPIGTFGGTLASFSAVDLGVKAVEGLIVRAGVSKEMIEEVIIGNVLSAGKGQNVARQVAVNAGLPFSVPASTVGNVCGSGMKAVINGVQAILSGDREVVLVGGTESMSQAGYVSSDSRWGMRMGHSQLTDTILSDGLTDAFSGIHMGITAENLAERFHISREEQDAFALNSQEKALKAIENHQFEEEIVPITIQQKKKAPFDMTTDEGPRTGLSLEKLGNLKAVFKADGTVTAGNASGINDGAAMLLLMSKEKAETLGISYMATIKSYAFEGVEPDIMGYGPVVSTRKALDKIGMCIKEIDLVESNEAFAAQSLTVAAELGLDLEKTNIYGGAIALGHPIGASGARILTTLLHGLEANKAKTGLATLCVGGGMGVSMIVERKESN
ncbi:MULTISPECIES: acetyl-CoA C-acetyltransferase [unclassified Enterococcus]|uniref:acetyl-CoA C-acetyltransferase n=1 Tax=unclassified Enterococcus TaxID=2608891 RepID=UPI001CE0C83D|nr:MULTISPECIES: acetyl-CoA C-acetyltransferase [unclassified Enterococcus]MCA5013944.1 acetyl-CoA C-acetyltransferase [Enterococcus sp. S23]MCA5017282.1 acetyl-CoA C-acetyltransferase [Enterococcus sp. S22(2020)]